MTEREVEAHVRIAWRTAGYARNNCPPEEFQAVFAELKTLTDWQLKRKAS